ncbi:MAG: ACP S-malonyltransferase [Gammaproteobacteria bacterium]|nr:ACP S-malonyltransferase [Gammaproteobacteria bacterium]
MSLAFTFPGQGSQSVGMMAGLAAAHAQVGRTFAEASEVLGYDLWAICRDGPAEALNATEVTQPAMLTAAVATYRIWRSLGGPVPKAMAGHSLGEFSALVAAGSLEFRDAVALVRFRAQAMQEAVPQGEGAMAAILGLEDSDVEAACAEAAQGEVVEAVNFNAPGQVVIAGRASAVARAVEAATARGAKRAVMLPISVPAHSSLMAPAAARLGERLAEVQVLSPQDVAVYGVDVKQHRRPDEIRAALVKQLRTPVYWAATVRTIIGAGATVIVECGPGKVLGSLNRRIDKNRDLKMISLEDPKSIEEALLAAQAV